MHPFRAEHSDILRQARPSRFDTVLDVTLLVSGLGCIVCLFAFLVMVLT